MNKRGLSPVVATALLIGLVIILAAIIFLWARSFLTERNAKFGEPIENACENIVFDAEVIPNKIIIANKGAVPLYKFEIYSSGTLSRELIDSVGCPNGRTINSGDSCEITVTIGSSEINVVPIILGQKGDSNEQYSCKDSGKKIEVS